MKKLKLATIIGTRPEIIRLSIIIKKCDEFFDHSLIHTGQNYDYELNEIFFDDLDMQSLNLPSLETFLSLFLTLNFFLDVVEIFIISSYLLFLKYIVLFP